MSTKVFTVLIAEDHDLARESLSQALALQDEIKVLGAAANGAEVLMLAHQVNPQVVLMDIEMPILDGIHATQALKKQLSDVKVIMLTSKDQDETVFAAMGAGADGYCLKDIPTDRLVQVIELVAEGGIWLDPVIAQTVLSFIGTSLPVSTPAPQPAAPVAEPAPSVVANTPVPEYMNLTKRELEILELIAKGFSNPDIAGALHLSLYTVKTHVCHILGKLAVSDRTHAAVRAMQAGLVSVEPDLA